MHKLRHLAAVLKQRLFPGAASTRPASPTSAAPTDPTVDFKCNICGHPNASIPLQMVQNREMPSCGSCGSSLRMRSVVHALSVELFGEPRILPEFPVDRGISGLGMSDWDGYAKLLKGKLDYLNTYYHTEPRLDITDIPADRVGQSRFLISSDVFEHIPGFALDNAFRNSRRLLRDGGVFLLTVPFTKHGETQEHFPNLYDFQIIGEGGARVLHNRSADGREEVFDQLVFHGGDGMTLEMRIFSEPDLRRRLAQAGFSSVRVYSDQVPQFGILWPMDWAVPIAARA